MSNPNLYIPKMWKECANKTMGSIVLIMSTTCCCKNSIPAIKICYFCIGFILI